jgi:hypothetical protein
MMILSLVYYVMHKGGALSRAEPWSTTCLHPVGDLIASPRVSDLLRSLSDASRQRFLSLWLACVVEHDWLCYDITSASSHARHNEYARYGYNRDGDRSNRSTWPCCSGRRAACRRTAAACPETSATWPRSGRRPSPGLTRGRQSEFRAGSGFYSAANIDALFRLRHKFAVAIPAGRKWVEEILGRHREDIASPANCLSTGEDDALYVATEFPKWGRVGIAAGFTFSSTRAAPRTISPGSSGCLRHQPAVPVASLGNSGSILPSFAGSAKKNQEPRTGERDDPAENRD